MSLYIVSSGGSKVPALGQLLNVILYVSGSMHKLLGILLAFGITLSSAQPSHAACPPPDVMRAMKSEKAWTEGHREKGYALEFSDFYKFCGRHQEAVLCAGGAGRDLTLAEVQAVDARVRASFEYQDDIIQYNLPDYWAINQLCGDCEDFSLVMSEELAKAGEAGPSMGLVLWFPTDYDGHATLVVKTSDAGYVEIGVGPIETPATIDWMKGRRLAVIWMDGKKWVSKPPISRVTKSAIGVRGNEVAVVDLTPIPKAVEAVVKHHKKK